jgi:hypothetical protein
LKSRLLPIATDSNQLVWGMDKSLHTSPGNFEDVACIADIDAAAFTNP